MLVSAGRLVPAAGLVIALAVGGVAAAEFTFTRIADTETPVPGGAGTFSLFADARSLDGETVVFVGLDDASNEGVYLFDAAGLDVLVDESTPVPGTTDTFTSFFAVAVDGPFAVFTAGSPGVPEGCAFSGTEGLYAVRLDDRSVVTVTDTDATPANCFHGVDFDGGRALVAGGVEPVDLFHNHSEALLGASGIGRLRLFVDVTTPVPGGGGRTFTGIDQEVVLSGTSLAFAEILPDTFGAVAGVYELVPGGEGLVTVADDATPVPGKTGTFMNFAGMDYDAGTAAFVGRDASGVSGAYVASDTGLRVVADSSTPVPGTGFTFAGVSNPLAHAGGRTAFSGFWGSDNGLFIEIDGVLEPVLQKGDLLDGRVVEQAFTGTGQLDGDHMLVRVVFAGFSAQGLYRVTIAPEEAMADR